LKLEVQKIDDPDFTVLAADEAALR